MKEFNESKCWNWQEWIAKLSAPKPRLLTFFNVKSSSRYSLVHMLPTSSSKSGPNPTFSLNEFMRSTAQWRCGWHPALVSTSSSKSSPSPSFFYDFYMKSSSRCSHVRILSTTFPDRGVHPRKQRPSSGDHRRPLYRKKNLGFCARDFFQAWIHAFPITDASQLLDDDVVDMTMWLAWWWDS